MTDDDRQQFRDEVKSALIEAIAEAPSLRIDSETHHAHHQWIDDMLERRRKRDKLAERVKGNLIVAGAIALFSGIGTLGLWILQQLPKTGS